MKYNSWVLLFFIWISFEVSSQNKFEIVKGIDKGADIMTTDRLGNLYLAKDNFIWLYNNKGDSIGAFNSKKYGEITYLDATDPYKIMVFFRDYNMIVFLDNYLSENGPPVDLQAIGFDQVVMSCQSRENGFWVFDQVKQKAFHLNEAFKITHETVNLSQWFNNSIVPTSMVEYNNRLYLNEKESGIYIFDHFATFLKKIALSNLDQFQVLERGLNYLDSNLFCQYNFQDFSSNCRELDFSGIKSARIEKNRFYILKKDEAIIYKTN